MAVRTVGLSGASTRALEPCSPGDGLGSAQCRRTFLMPVVPTLLCVKVTGELVKSGAPCSARHTGADPGAAFRHVPAVPRSPVGGTNRSSVECWASHHTPLCPQPFTVADGTRLHTRGAQQGSRPCLSLARWSRLGSSPLGTHGGWARTVGQPGLQGSR